MQALCENAMGTAEQLKDVARALEPSKLAALSIPLLDTWPPVSPLLILKSCKDSCGENCIGYC